MTIQAIVSSLNHRYLQALIYEPFVISKQVFFFHSEGKVFRCSTAVKVLKPYW